MNTNDIQLRPAHPEDVDVLFDLHKATMKEYVERLWSWDEDWQKQRLLEDFDPALTQIVQFQGQDVGVLILHSRPQEWFIARIEVLPEFQNRGIGAALINRVYEMASAQHKPVALQVFKINPASRLYQRLGFQITGETEYHYQMRKD